MSKKTQSSYPPIYIQSSNPSKKLLKWIDKMSEEGHIVYLQSGTPPPPPNPPK